MGGVAMSKEDRFSFTAHALERGLERMLEIEAPYTKEQYFNIKKLITLNMIWSELESQWVLEDWDLLLVIKNEKCVSIVPRAAGYEYNKPVTELQKNNHKLYKKLGRKKDDGR